MGDTAEIKPPRAKLVRTSCRATSQQESQRLEGILNSGVCLVLSRLACYLVGHQISTKIEVHTYVLRGPLLTTMQIIYAALGSWANSPP